MGARIIGDSTDDTGRVLIVVGDDGRLEILTGFTEVGQGLHTILRQVVCEEPGLDPSVMSVRTTSDPRVLCGMTTASRATALCTAAGRKAADTPPVEVILVEVPDDVGGYGSKGLGEIGLVPTAGAVAAALHAHDGIWRNTLPMTDAPAARTSVPKSRRGEPSSVSVSVPGFGKFLALISRGRATRICPN